MLMKKSLVGAVVILGFGLVASADNVTFTGAAGVAEDGTYKWADGRNWSTTALPGENDTVYIKNDVGADPLKIDLGGETYTIRELRYQSTPKAILTNGKLRLVTGGLFGNMNDYGVYCDIEILQDGRWANDDSWGQSAVFGGTVSGDYTITASGNQNNSLMLDGAQVYVPALLHSDAGLNIRPGTHFFGTALTEAGGFADGNYNGTNLRLQLNQGDQELSAEDYQVFRDGASVTYTDSGAALEYYPPTSVAVDQRLAFALEHGRCNIQFGSPKVAGSYLTFTNFTRNAGSLMSYSHDSLSGATYGTDYGFRIDGLVNNEAGVIGGWAYQGGQLLRVIDDKGTVEVVPQNDYLQIQDVVASGGSPTALAINWVAACDFTQDVSVYSIWDTSGGDKAYNLGDYHLDVYGALHFNWGGGNKVFSSSDVGGVVFHGDDIILQASGWGRMEFACPVSWVGNPGGVAYPNICIINGKQDGYIFSGEDRILDYGDINASLYNNWLVFDGSADRTIHGDLYDVVKIEQRGTGSLTFKGASHCRSIGLSVTGGKMVFDTDGIGVSVTVTNGVFELAEGHSMTQTPKLWKDGVYQGFGTTSWGLRDGRWQVGGVLAPGNEERVGTLTMGGAKPEGDFSILCRIGLEDNGKTVITQNNKLTLPPSGSVGTIRVADLTKRARRIRETDEFVLVDYTKGSLENSSNEIVWTFSSDTPKDISVDNASVLFKDKKLVLTGLKSMARGLVIYCR